MIDRPNIILIYTDQQRYDTLGINGNALIQTPNLDAMGRDGMHFRRGYVTTPICVCSRVALFTGRYNHTNLSYSNGRPIFDREVDGASVLRANGYRTALIGKDHCFGDERLKQAFDHTWVASHAGFRDPETDAHRRVNEARESTMYLPFTDDPVPPEENITGDLFRSAREYIDDQGSEPFFMWLSIPDPSREIYRQSVPQSWEITMGIISVRKSVRDGQKGCGRIGGSIVSHRVMWTNSTI